MARSAKRLGRGLDSLVSDLRASSLDHAASAAAPTDSSDPDHSAAVATAAGYARSLAIADLHPNPHQPRSSITDENVLSLAASIRASGLLQPIVVRLKNGRYEIIAGERRWRAARLAGLSEVPVLVRDVSDQQAVEFSLIENIQREDLNAIDRARAYRQFCDRFQLKPEEVAERVGEDRTTVVNYLRLLDLSDDIAEFVVMGKLSMGHARCLLGVKDERLRSRLAESAAENDLSVRALEEIVRRRRTSREDARPAREDRVTPHIRDTQQRFEEAIKTKVTIREGRKKGTGRVVIEYYSLDDFDRIASAFGVDMP